ncbi:MAG: hypothetical protein H0W08_14560 [Acidobacteria bacterium]|nr:hypothetical protein [Acidobacteriota bacterium]
MPISLPVDFRCLIAQVQNLERTMIPHMPAALAILLMAASLAPESSQGSDPGRFLTGGNITLRLEYSAGSSCELTTHVDVWAASKGRRSVALSCDGRKAHRTLTQQEADDFLRLARGSQLYRARGIGRDGCGGDAWLASVKVTDGGLIVVLVVSGNPEFDSGPRREVLEFLQKLFTELRPRLESANRK